MYGEYEDVDYHEEDDIDLSDYECVEDEDAFDEDEEVYSNQCTWCDGCGCNRCL